MQEMTTKRIERFLEDFANLKPKDVADTERFLVLYKPVFPQSFPAEILENERKRDKLLADDPITAGAVNREEGRTDSELREAVHQRIWGLAHQLRNIWDEPDFENKEWYAYELRRWFYVRTEPERSRRIPAPPPANTIFQKALKHLKADADRARRCVRPGCMKPYYFSPDRRATRYCSPPCAEWAKQDAKLRWDRKHRSQKRENQ